MRSPHRRRRYRFTSIRYSRSPAATAGIPTSPHAATVREIRPRPRPKALVRSAQETFFRPAGITMNSAMYFGSDFEADGTLPEMEFDWRFATALSHSSVISARVSLPRAPRREASQGFASGAGAVGQQAKFLVAQEPPAGVSVRFLRCEVMRVKPPWADAFRPRAQQMRTVGATGSGDPGTGRRGRRCSRRRGRNRRRRIR